jgi:hypothetical protein
MEEDSQWARVGGKDDDFGDSAVEGLGAWYLVNFCVFGEVVACTYTRWRLS